MKLNFKVTTRDAERILWLAAVLLLAAGYYLITQHYEKSIAASSDRSAAYFEKTNANRKLVAESGRAERLRGELRKTLSGVLVKQERSQSMAVLLHDLDALAHTKNIQVVAIAPQSGGGSFTAHHVAPSAAATPLPRDPNPLQNTALDISARGRFSQLLALIAQLPRQRVLLQVTDVRFELAGGQHSDPAKPLLDARIHTLVYHIAKPDLVGEL